MRDLSRRSFLVTGLAAAGATALPAGVARAASPSSGRLADPFALGVASGDPWPDGFVLWTRLAPVPLAEDGRGGMPARTVPVQWQVAEDPSFARPVRSGAFVARPEDAHSVHVELDGLQPGREYWYRFRAEGHLSPVGRTTTAPAADASPSALHLAVASCSQYEHGFFTAYRRLAESEPDLVLHLGDYLYEYRRDTYVAGGGNVRHHDGPETETLAGYRQRHAQYKSDPDLQLAHAAAPWLVVWDDHELDNNWADEVPERPQDPQPHFLARREAAFRAYYENMPLRRTSVPQGIDLQLFRRVRWGRLANLHMLDTRQYRSDQACGDGTRSGCAEAADPSRTILGATQRDWLRRGLRESDTTWDVLGQQVFFAQRDFTAGPRTSFSMDGWDGYTADRDGLLRDFAAFVRNPVVLTGDVHRHYAADLRADFADPSSRTVGVELVATSISTGGDGSDRTAATDTQLAENPHLRFANTQRGWVSAVLEPGQLTARFQVLPYVQQAGAPAQTRATFVVPEGEPGLHQVQGDPARLV